MFIAMRGASRLWLLPTALAAAVVAVPLIAVIVASLMPAGEVWRHLRETLLASYIGNSLLLMALVGLLALILGVTSAWLVAACRFPGRKILSWMLVLPLAAPAYVVAYAYTDLLEVSGPLQTLIRDLLGLGIEDWQLTGIRSLPGAAVLLALVLYPYVYLLARASFAARSGAQFEAARTLGHSPFAAFRRVALPAARPAIAAGLALVLMETLADFGVVDYFGVPAFSTGIYRTWIGLGDRAAAMRLAGLMLLFVLILVTLESLSRKGQPHAGDYRQAASLRLEGLPAAAATAFCLIPVLLGFLVPVGVLLWHKLRSGGDQLFGRGFLDYLANSVSVSVAAALIATALALLLGYAQRLRPGAASGTLLRVATLGYALPGVLLAIGLLGPLGFVDRTLTEWLRDTTAYSGGLLLSGTTAILVYAYVCRFLTVSFNSVQSGFEAISPAMDAAARSLGASPGGVVRRVHLPMLTPSLSAAALLVFVDAMRELPATLMLRPFNFDTLATRVYQLASDERLGEASTAALCIVLVGIVPVLLINRIGSGSRSA